MKVSSGTKVKHRKWSMQECDESDGWKLKDVRRTKVKAESLDGAKIIKEIYSTNFDTKFNDRYWRIGEICLIENDRLKAEFDTFKNEHIELGRDPEALTETLVFSAESERACKDICQEGYKVSSKKRHVLGHTGSGVHLVRHYDILTRYLMFQQYNSPAYIMVYKTYFGKTKPIVPRLHKEDNYVPPYLGFDSHVSARHVHTNMPICEALNCSYVYLYEFDAIASNPVKYPRQILPYAVIQLEKKVPCVPENPFPAVGCEETRSTWEVKGETRRGFRFMFTKSGLKGKHKVFSKALTKEDIGMHLKGQLLEMRTKPKNSLGEGNPPRLIKMDNSSLTDDKTKQSLDTRKPPNLQKCIGVCSASSCGKDTLEFGPEYKHLIIPKHIRDNFKLSNFKPSVKLKRLDSSYSRKVMVKHEKKTKTLDVKVEVKNGSMITDQSAFEHVSKDTDTSSLNESVNISEPLAKKTQEDITKWCKASGHSSDKYMGFQGADGIYQSRNDGGKCTKTGSTKLFVAKSGESRQCKKTKVTSSKSSESTKDDGKCRLTTHPPSKHGVKSEITNGKSDNTDSGKTLQSQNNLYQTPYSNCDSACRTRSVNSGIKETNHSKRENLSEVNHRSECTKLMKNVDREKASITSKCANTKKKELSFSLELVPSSSERQNKTCAPEQNRLADTEQCVDGLKQSVSEKTNTDSNNRDKNSKDISEEKTDQSYRTPKTIPKSDCVVNGDDVQMMHSSTSDKHFKAKKKYPDGGSQCILGNLPESKDKEVSVKTQSRKKKTSHEKQKENTLSQTETADGLPKRFSPRKTKFGKVVYTVTKYSDGTGKDYTNTSDKKSQNKSDNNDFDFLVLSNKHVKRQKSMKTFSKRDRKCTENIYLDKCTESESVSNSSSNNSLKKAEKYEHVNTDISKTGPGQSGICEGKSTDKHSYPGVPCEVRPVEISDQSQPVVLEKSKSPELANAAPDILNTFPVPLAAQTSTSPYQNCAALFENKGKEKSYGIPDKKLLRYKSSIFLSEMSTMCDKIDPAKSVTEHFQKPISQNHVVVATSGPPKHNPQKQTQRYDHDDKSNFETSFCELEIQSGANMRQEDGNKNSRQHECQTVFERKIITQSITQIPGNTKDATSKHEHTSSTSTSSDDCKRTAAHNNAICQNVLPFKTQTNEALNSSAQVDSKISEGNTFRACNKASIFVASKSENMPKKLCESNIKTNENGEGKTNDQEKQVKLYHATKCVPRLTSSIVETDLSSASNKETHIKDASVMLTVPEDLGDERNINTSCLEEIPADTDANVNNHKVDDHQNKSNKKRKTNANLYMYHSAADINVKSSDESNHQPTHRDVNTNSSDEHHLPSLERDSSSDKSKHRSQSFEPKSKSKCSQDNSGNIEEIEGDINPECSDKRNTRIKLMKRRALSNKRDHVRDVKIDTSKADRLRYFLGTTAAVAMQRKKYVEDKSVINENSNPSDTQTTDIHSQIQSSNNGCDKNRNEYEGQSLQCKQSSSQHTSCGQKPLSCTTDLDLHSNIPLSQPNLTYNRTNRRIDSAEIHDNDSQDTVIGGVTNITNSPIRPGLQDSCNDGSNLKQFETLLTQLNSNLSDSSFSIKEEREDLGYEEVEKGYVKESSIEFETSALKYRNNHENSNASNAPDTSDLVGRKWDNSTLLNEVKQEPAETPVDTSNPPSRDIASSMMRNDACDRSNFFPHTRRELEKGSAILNATDCRSAIVDTLKELSSVLKCLTENNIQDSKQTQKVTQVAKEMCNALSGETGISTFHNSSDNAVPCDIVAPFDPHLDSHIKTEHVETSTFTSQVIPPTVKEESAAISSDYGHYSEENCGNFKDEFGEQSFKYEYILKSSDDEYQSTGETENNPLALSEENETSHCAALDTLESNVQEQTIMKRVTENNEFALNRKYERDALPQLFDPRDEPDVTCLEKFGIPFVLSRDRGTKEKFDIKSRHGIVLARDSTVKTKLSNINISPTMTNMKENTDGLLKKRKLSLNIKSGLLNKGVKERKNMFDLKINRSRRNQENQTFEKKLHAESVKTKIETPAEKSCKTIETGNVKVENHCMTNNRLKHRHVIDKVYRNVCEKLSTLKENGEECKPVLHSSMETVSSSDSSENKNESDCLTPDGNKLSIDHHKTCDVSTKNSEGKKSENVKKHTLIPFKTVARLKREKYRKFKRGETQKNCLDYREVSTRMYKERTIHVNSSNRQGNSKEKSLGVFQKKTENNENNGKILNYFISNAKTSNVSDREDSNRSKEQQDKKIVTNRQHTDADEEQRDNRMKGSSDDVDNGKPSTRRSRSESSHRSSQNGRHRSKEQPVQSYNDKHRPFNCNAKPLLGKKAPQLRQFNSKHYYSKANQFHGRFGKSSFTKRGTGYFSWRRKYQSGINKYYGCVALDKASTIPDAEYAKWTRFRERELLRNQIEHAIKDYRRTFEQTPDDKKGDEKVASYLNFLTEKLNKIQNKRDQLNELTYPPFHMNGYYRNKRKRTSPTRDFRVKQADREWDKLEKAQTFLQHKTHQHSSVSHFSESLASDSHILPYKQRRHTNDIEELLKEHIHKHCEHLTKQIKEEISKEIEERKALKSNSSTSIKNHEDQAGDSNHQRYVRERSYDMNRRHVHERNDLRRSDRDRVSLRKHQNYESRRGNRDDPHHRGFYDKYDYGKYPDLEAKRDYRHGIEHPHRHTFKKQYHPYRTYQNSAFNQRSHEDCYPKSRYFSTSGEGVREYSKFRDKYETYKDNTPRYRYHKTDTYRAYHIDNSEIYKQGRKHHGKHRNQNQRLYYKNHNKGTKHAKYRPRDDYEANQDGKHDTKVKDEFDATNYRKVTVSRNKKSQNSKSERSTLKITCQQSKFSDERNLTPDYFNGNDGGGDGTEDTGEGNAITAKTK